MYNNGTTTYFSARICIIVISNLIIIDNYVAIFYISDLDPEKINIGTQC